MIPGRREHHPRYQGYFNRLSPFAKAPATPSDAVDNAPIPGETRKARAPAFDAGKFRNLLPHATLCKRLTGECKIFGLV
jgi:hypothetical protein